MGGLTFPIPEGEKKNSKTEVPFTPKLSRPPTEHSPL